MTVDKGQQSWRRRTATVACTLTAAALLVSGTVAPGAVSLMDTSRPPLSAQWSALELLKDTATRAPGHATLMLDDSTVVPFPPTSAAHLTRPAALAQAAIAPLTLVAGAYVSMVEPQDLFDMLTVEPARTAHIPAVTGGTITPSAASLSTSNLTTNRLDVPAPTSVTASDMTLRFADDALHARIDAIAAAANVAPHPRIIMSGVVVAQGAPGLVVDVEAARNTIATVLTGRLAGSRQAAVLLPMTEVPFPVREVSPGAFNSPDTIHLTFDDGPGAHTEEILDILAEHEVHATFYVLGGRLDGNEGTISRILADGHRLGNHSWGHPKLSTLSRAAIDTEIVNTQQRIADITGVFPTAFRPPYGALNSDVVAAADAAMVSIDLWTCDPEDWRNPGGDTLADRVIACAQPGTVVLLHVLNQSTVDALPRIIADLREQGLNFD
jgi:peptidoglycan/xylan/chitin deacetylase (PgdA/CDA1 family)